MVELCVWCNGGLGNRLRPLLSIISILKNIPTKVNLVVVWKYNRTCQIRLEKLFQLKATNEETVNLDDYMFMGNPNTRQQFTCNGLPIKDIYHTNNIDKLFENNLLINTPHWLKSKYIDTSLYPSIFRSLLHKDTIASCLDIKNKYNIDKTVIGCHLRSTDLHNIPKLNEIIEKIRLNIDQKYFICADNEDTENIFRNYKNVVIIKKKSYVQLYNSNNSNFRRNYVRDELSVQEALIDLCILSMCNTSDDAYHTIPESTFLDVSRKISTWENI